MGGGPKLGKGEKDCLREKGKRGVGLPSGPGLLVARGCAVLQLPVGGGPQCLLAELSGGSVLMCVQSLTQTLLPEPLCEACSCTWGLCEFPLAAVTSNHELADLKHHVRSRTGLQVRGLTQLCRAKQDPSPCGGSEGRTHSRPPSASRPYIPWPVAPASIVTAHHSCLCFCPRIAFCCYTVTYIGPTWVTHNSLAKILITCAKSSIMSGNTFQGLGRGDIGGVGGTGGGGREGAPFGPTQRVGPDHLFCSTVAAIPPICSPGIKGILPVPMDRTGGWGSGFGGRGQCALRQWLSKCGPGSAALASPGSLLDLHVLGAPQASWIGNSGMGCSSPDLNKPCLGSCLDFKF